MTTSSMPSCARRRSPIAYRMLGSVSEAEDAVQEGFLRLHRTLERRREDRVAARLPDRGGDAAVHRPAALGARAARDATSASGCPEPLRRRRPGPPRRDGRLAVARVPRAAGEPVARAARGVPAARGVRLPVRRDRRDRRQERGQRAPARRPGAPPRRGAPAALRGVARAPRRSSPTASSRRSGTASSRRSRSCWPQDVVLHGDGGGKAPALARALHGRARVARTLRAWVAPSARARRVTCAASRSTASPGRSRSTPRAASVNVMALDIADGPDPGDPLGGRTRTSCTTSARWPT